MKTDPAAEFSPKQVVNPSNPIDHECLPGEAIETLLSEYDVARVTRMSLAAVRRWRARNFGPPFLKLGASVRYDPRALREWLASRPVGGDRIPEGCR